MYKIKVSFINIIRKIKNILFSQKSLYDNEGFPNKEK